MRWLWQCWLWMNIIGILLYISDILNVKDEDLKITSVLWRVYHPMKVYGFLDEEALMNDIDNEDNDDVDIDQLVEELMQCLIRMNG